MKQVWIAIVLIAAVQTPSTGADKEEKVSWSLSVGKFDAVSNSKEVILYSYPYRKNNGPALQIGCYQGKPYLAFREGFGISNGVSDALNKSEFERQIHKGYQYETFGFSSFVDQGNLLASKVRLRFEGETEAREVVAGLGIQGTTQSLLIHKNNQSEEVLQLIAHMKDDAILYVDLPYKDKPRPAVYHFYGLSGFLGRATREGCDLSSK